MAKSSHEIEKEFIFNIKNSTNSSLEDWMILIQNSKMKKRNDIIKWLKEKYNFGHMNASLLVGIYLNEGKPVYGSSEELLEAQLCKNENLRSLFNAISNKILEKFSDAKMIPKKTYISFTGKREFAAINVKSKEIRLGMDLGDKQFIYPLEKSKLSGPMPRISHMVIFQKETDFNEEINKFLEESYNRVNN